MSGKIRRKLIEQAPPIFFDNTPLICPICEREIPTAQRDAHHLIPKSRGGKDTQFLHRICHRQIHALFTDKELANQYNNVAQLLTHPEMITFVAWVKTKPNYLIERSRKSQRIRIK
jgi:HNH endonuclease